METETPPPKLTGTAAPGSATAYTNDGNGDPSSKTVTTGTTTTTTYYSFGVYNRMYGVFQGAAALGLYGYDGLNRRVASVENGAASYYAYLGTEVLYSFTGSTPTNYVYANGLLVAKIVAAENPLYYQSDSLGSTRLVTDYHLNVVFSDGYQPYGSDNGPAQCSGACETVKYTGKPYRLVLGCTMSTSDGTIILPAGS
jgi:YD repeat-containing protein